MSAEWRSAKRRLRLSIQTLRGEREMPEPTVPRSEQAVRASLAVQQFMNMIGARLSRVVAGAVAAPVMSSLALRATRILVTVTTSGLVLLPGCSAEAGPEQVDTVPDTGSPATESLDTTYVARLSCEGLETSILQAGPSRNGLRIIHGEPDSVTMGTEPNRHIEGATDSLFTVFYPGFQASFRTPPSGRDLISSATITDNRYISDERIGIGAEASDVIRALGEATVQDARQLIYDCGMATEQPVTFHLGNGRVTAISIEYYVD